MGRTTPLILPPPHSALQWNDNRYTHAVLSSINAYHYQHHLGGLGAFTRWILPLELHKEIISHLWDDPIALCNCALTCRLYYSASRRQLYRRIHIRTREYLDFIQGAVWRNPWLFALSRQLVITDDYRAPFAHVIPHILGNHFSKLASLAFHNVDWRRIPAELLQSFFLLTSTMASITELRLHQCHFASMRDVGRLLCSFSRLENLSLDTVDWPVLGRNNYFGPRMPELRAVNLNNIRSEQIVDFSNWLVIAKLYKRIGWFSLRDIPGTGWQPAVRGLIHHIIAPTERTPCFDGEPATKPLSQRSYPLLYYSQIQPTYSELEYSQSKEEGPKLTISWRIPPEVDLADIPSFLLHVATFLQSGDAGSTNKQPFQTNCTVAWVGPVGDHYFGDVTSGEMAQVLQLGCRPLSIYEPSESWLDHAIWYGQQMNSLKLVLDTISGPACSFAAVIEKLIRLTPKAHSEHSMFHRDCSLGSGVYNWLLTVTL
ncbi:hypothetical protein WOLCODRAFT_20535 [Wolfiporia cocos MD-104 SS10]|uniref:F-box domain-containing protein n=1 Tax=Wolfiporia cocos (strain MD-104) TaxID=742152 RepID=A0A2H3J440_WOLCO|nr:hypothetical protein WOLCODRAFT_20535 [Wolfiporia cocos MD-104 SS10]